MTAHQVSFWLNPRIYGNLLACWINNGKPGRMVRHMSEERTEMRVDTPSVDVKAFDAPTRYCAIVLA